MFHYCKLYSLEPPKLADSYPHRSSSPLCSSAVRIALKIESWMTAHWTPVDLRLLCIWLCTLPLIYLLHYTPSLLLPLSFSPQSCSSKPPLCPQWQPNHLTAHLAASIRQVAPSLPKPHQELISHHVDLSVLRKWGLTGFLCHFLYIHICKLFS